MAEQVKLLEFPQSIFNINNGLKCFQEHIIQPRFASGLITIFEGSHKNCREVIAFPLNLLFFEGRNLPQCLKSLAEHRVRAVHSLGTPPHNALMVYAKNPWQSSVFGQYISDGTSPHKAFKVQNQLNGVHLGFCLLRDYPCVTSKAGQNLACLLTSKRKPENYSPSTDPWRGKALKINIWRGKNN